VEENRRLITTSNVALGKMYQIMFYTADGPADLV
jgi:hypothetical protein